jgi:hypothetical protein
VFSPAAVKPCRKGVTKKKATPKQKPVGGNIVPAIGGGGLIDRSQIDELVAETGQNGSTAGRRILRSRKGSDNARQDSEAKLTRSLTAANKAMKDRRAAVHAKMAT